MESTHVAYYVLEGSHEEIGQQLAVKVGVKAGVVQAPKSFTEIELKEALELYHQYCPGLSQELESYANACQVSIRDVAYTWMTYLVPRCSGLIVGGSLMKDGHTRLIRNYEFDIDHEDLLILETKPKGRYAHIGGSVTLFGRSEGINEHGLAVSMASCGLPVSNLDGMREPHIKGLQFWAVIRSLLENCKNVAEAITLVKEMPIAYNINLFLADAEGHGCIVETMHGEQFYAKITSASEKKYLCATNHIAIPSFQHKEPYAMKNSVVRLQTLENYMEAGMTKQCQHEEEALKELFAKRYPEGLSAPYYDDFFGTIKTVVMDTVNRSYQIHWLLEEENGWESYQLGDTHEDHTLAKCYQKERAHPSFFEPIQLVINETLR